jgi:hypothetical protein
MQGERMNEKPPVPLLGVKQARVCGRLVGDGSCDEPAITHYFLNEDAENIYACGRHAREIEIVWSYYQRHQITPCCGMPGALWFPDENTCRYEDGLPTAEKQRYATATA